MPLLEGFTARVSARTRTGQMILSEPPLLTAYKEAGGLPTDLNGIVEHGLRAEAANRGQSEAAADGKAATVTVLTSFDDLRTKYSATMAVVQAVHGDLKRAGVAASIITAVEQILVNETPVRIIEKAPGKKVAKKALSQEAIRAEIEKDAAALLNLAPVLPYLEARQVTKPKLEELRDGAAGLSGRLGERAVKKGAAKAATAAERAAVKAQKEFWGACYRILAIVGRKDPRVQQLLAEAADAGK